MGLEGRTVCVTGGASAVARACVERLMAAGCRVLVVDPDELALADLCARHPGLLAERAGVAHGSDAVAVAARCSADWGRLDAFLHVAAAMETWPQDDDDPARWPALFEANVVAPAAFTEALAPLLAQGDRPGVVYLGSIDGIRGNAQVAGYSATKGALTVLTHTMAQRLGRDGVRVNCVAAAGVVQLPLGAAVDRYVGDSEAARRATPLNRMPSADEIAAVCVFLAGPEASYVSGAVVPVDGGRIAATPGTW